MAGPDRFSPTIEHLRLLIAQCEAIRARSEQMGVDTARIIQETEQRIEECIDQLGRELGQRE